MDARVGSDGGTISLQSCMALAGKKCKLDHPSAASRRDWERVFWHDATACSLAGPSDKLLAIRAETTETRC